MKKYSSFGIEWPDLRRKRAMALTAEVVKIVSKHTRHLNLENRTLRDMADEIMDRFTAEGVEVLTDHDRTIMHLPARGRNGWTTEEVIELEAKRLEMLRQPVVTWVSSDDLKKIKL